jgi:hypothetical protein
VPNVAIDGGAKDRLGRRDTAEEDNKQKKLRLYSFSRFWTQWNLLLLE